MADVEARCGLAFAWNLDVAHLRLVAARAESNADVGAEVGQELIDAFDANAPPLAVIWSEVIHTRPSGNGPTKLS